MTHGMHGPPSLPWNPELHWQSVILLLDGGALELAGQNEHAAEPLALLNWSAAHGEHVFPPAPVQPAEHVQLVATSSEVEPTGQIEHASGPGAALNVPGPHCVHTAACAPVYPALHSHAPAETLPAGESELRGHA